MYTAVDGLLNKLLQVLCPVRNLLPKSFYKVKQLFIQLNTNTILQKVCNVGQLVLFPSAKLSKLVYQVSYNTSYTRKFIILFIDYWNEITVPNIHATTTNALSDISIADGIKQHLIFFSVKS